MKRSKVVAIISKRTGISKKGANSIFLEIVSHIAGEFRKDARLRLPGVGSVALVVPEKKQKRKAPLVAKPRSVKNPVMGLELSRRKPRSLDKLYIDDGVHAPGGGIDDGVHGPGGGIDDAVHGSGGGRGKTVPRAGRRGAMNRRSKA
jgi:nucleoid DNA-binding protein